MHRRFGSTGAATVFERSTAGAGQAAAASPSCLSGWPLALLNAAPLALALAVPGVAAQSGKPANPSIYSCVDERGRRLTADRPIPECLAKEQRVLNADGSLKDLRPPSLTPQERADQEARERKLAQERAARAEALRRDRNLLQRYPNLEAHERARESALQAVRQAQALTDQRLADLDRERAPLLAEAEFYRGKPLPARLKTQLDANDAARAAQRDASANQAQEIDRISRLFDADLVRLRQLWAAAAPGSGAP